MRAVRRNRHGRGQRTDTDPRRRPADGFRTRDLHRFTQLVDEALALLPPPLAGHAERAELLVDDVPAGLGADLGEVPLARFERTRPGRPDRLTVYRRPLEARAGSRAELVEVIRLAAGEEIADALGLDPPDDEL